MSKSPSRLGKFAQMALEQQNKMPTEEQLDNLSQKYGRNQSRERLEKSQISASNNDIESSQPVGNILRPVSGKSNSNRYTSTEKAGPLDSAIQEMTLMQRPQSNIVLGLNGLPSGQQ